MVKVRENLSGQKFNRLTVIEQIEDYITTTGSRYAQYLCECDCGNKIKVIGSQIKNGLIKSCGCLHSEKSRENGKANKKYNTYDLSGEYGIGYTLKGEPFYFDLEDYDKIKDYCWYVNKNGYIKTNKKGNSFMHNLILPDIKRVDHIKTERKFDNRKLNLREVTASQNGMNSKLSKNNTSGVTGVSWNKTKNKWNSYIMINYKKKSLGYYDNFENAVKARKEAEEKYCGEHSYDNSQKLYEELNGGK